MTGIDSWLRDLGLAQYSAAFARHDIDLEVLPTLSDRDLEQVGVSLGHRRKLLQAIATLATVTAPSAVAPIAVASEAQRRQVTVLFCDLVGSTDLANTIDPEDLSELIHRYQDACAGAMARYDGFLAKFLGDGVLAYFGYPNAREDSVLQSVRGGLAILESCAHLRRPDGGPLEVRVGVATGLVVIGEIIGDENTREHAIAGATPNLAARLQALAQPNQLLVSSATRELLGAQFECECIGEHALKGFTQPVGAWRVLREAPVESRFAAAMPSAGVRMMGRVQQLEQLHESWLRVCQGTGHVVLVQGEAGMGKSRLVDTVSRDCEVGPHARVLWQCSPDHTNSALLPVIRHLERTAGFAASDGAAARFRKLQMLLGDAHPEPSAISLFATLLSIAPDSLYAPVDAPAAARKAATLDALVAYLAVLAAREPLLLIVEDAHWIDPTTQDLLTRVFKGIAGMNMLALVTARTEYVWPWPVHGAVAACQLVRLDSAQSMALVEAVAAPRVLDASLVEEIASRSDGIPLFVQELTRAVLASQSGDRPVVPATLHDSLMSRLDQLGPAREIIQVAAVIGQQFPRSLLKRAAVDLSVDLMAGVARLVEAGFLVPESSRAAEPGYRFSHALMRDIAYENLLKGRRRQIHERVALALVEHSVDVVQTQPELVAQHFSEAGKPEAACEYYERAGDRAAAQSAYVEAVAHISAAHAEARKLPAGAQRLRREIDVLLKLGPAQSIVHGPQSPAVHATYVLARDLGVQAADDTAQFKATWGLWYQAITRQLDIARDRAQELLALGRKSADSDLMLEAFHCRWSTAWFRGDMATTVDAAAEGVRRYNPVQHSWMGPVFGGHDPGVCAHSCRAQALSMSGYTRQGRAGMQRALDLAEALGQPFTLGFAMMNTLALFQTLGDREAVIRVAERLLEVASRYNFPPLRAHAALLAGWAMAAGGDLQGGAAVMEREYPQAAAIAPLFRYYAAILADVLQELGRGADALALVQKSIDTVTEPGVGLYVPELHRLKGVCLMRSGERDSALDSLRTAVAIARQQGAVLLQVKAAFSLAALAPSSDHRAALREVCAALPNECDAPVLETCRQWLAQLTD